MKCRGCQGCLFCLLGRCATRMLDDGKVPFIPPQQMTVSEARNFIKFVKKRWKGEAPLDFALCDQLLTAIGVTFATLCDRSGERRVPRFAPPSFAVPHHLSSAVTTDMRATAPYV